MLSEGASHGAAARLLVFVLGLAVFYVLESLVRTRPWRVSRRRRLLVHLAMAAANSLLLRLTVAGPLLYLSYLVQRQEWGLAPAIGLTGWPELVVTVVVLDMGDYWWHRANHRVPLLWRFHQAHHSDTHVDVTTALRFHPGELLISGAVKAGWILLWGPSPAAFALFEAMISLTSQYHHSNIDFSDRWEALVRRVNVTPRMHASHHSAATESLDANFSTILSVWDRLFGTYVPPVRRHLAVQGLPYARERDLDLGAWLAMPFAAPEPLDDTSSADLKRDATA